MLSVGTPMSPSSMPSGLNECGEMLICTVSDDSVAFVVQNGFL